MTAPLNLGLLEDAVIAGTMAAANLAYRLLTAWRPTTTNPWLEFFERVVVTFLTGGIGALLQTGHFGFSDLRAAGLAGLATVFVAVKAGLAKLLGSSTASLLTIGKPDTPQTPAA